MAESFASALMEHRFAVLIRCGVPSERAWLHGNDVFFDAGVSALEFQYEAAPVCRRDKGLSDVFQLY